MLKRLRRAIQALKGETDPNDKTEILETIIQDQENEIRLWRNLSQGLEAIVLTNMKTGQIFTASRPASRQKGQDHDTYCGGRLEDQAHLFDGKSTFLCVQCGYKEEIVFKEERR